MLTQLYLTLRLRPSPALWSKDEGFLRVNPEQSPLLRLESRRVDLFLSKRRKYEKYFSRALNKEKKWKRNGVPHVECNHERTAGGWSPFRP